NIQNIDNDIDNALPSPKSLTRSQNQNNGSTSYIATNVLDILPENDIENNDNSQHNDIY
ncbi:10904_t:CDS:2, partial [Racocetra fulgida]